MSAHEFEDRDGLESASRANQVAAFARISRSRRSCLSSRRRRPISSRSGLVRPSSRRPASRSAWRDFTGAEQILARLHIFSELAFVAAAHHERLDGKGYPRGLTAPDLALDVRIVSTADISGLKPSDAAAFHKAWYGPNNATLFIVGDTTLAEITPKLEAALAGVASDHLTLAAYDLANPDALARAVRRLPAGARRGHRRRRAPLSRDTPARQPRRSATASATSGKAWGASDSPRRATRESW